MKQSVLLLFCAALLLVWSGACKHESGLPPGVNPTDPPTGGDQTCSPDTVYFQNKVLPLIISSCAKSDCHDAISQQDGIQLTSYQTIMNSGEVTPGNPNNSDLYEVLNETNPDKIMPRPPSSPLTAAEKDLIYRWIMQGAKNNACNDCDTLSFTYAAAVAPLINNNCKGCHNPSFLSAGLDLTNYNTVKSIALDGRFMGTVTHATGYQPMPRGAAKMSDCKITQIRKWIEDGSQNN